MRKDGLTDEALSLAIDEMAQGLIDADLGSCVLKKRVALPGQGKRGGARTIVASRFANLWFFLYGFSKNERSDISKEELRVFQEVAKELLSFDDEQILIALSSGEIMELGHDKRKA